MGLAHVKLVCRDLCKFKVKGFCVVSFIERNVSKKRHLQGVRHYKWTICRGKMVALTLASLYFHGCRILVKITYRDPTLIRILLLKSPSI